jgi:DNA-binding NtrC family response regulator
VLVYHGQRGVRRVAAVPLDATDGRPMMLDAAVSGRRPGAIMDYSILVCDDEPDVRAAMRRTLHRFQVTAVGSAAEAMAELKRQHFDAVVSDFNLSATSDGLGLLQMVRVLYPDTVRFLVTGNTDVQVAIRAVNEGSVHRFFLKPWDDEGLVAALDIQLHTHAPRRASRAG